MTNQEFQKEFNKQIEEAYWLNQRKLGNWGT